MADESAFCGTWKIVECVSLAGVVEPTGIEGTEFFLEESGDITWKLAAGTTPDAMPFFSCETYEVSLSDPACLKLCGTYAGHVGHVIEFMAELTDDLLLLTYERCCMLQCQKVSSNDPNDEQPYAYLNALEASYFSDLTIKAENGKEFKVHKIILGMTVPQLDWDKSPPPLSDLKPDVTATVLHYLYAQCLPPDLNEKTAKSCIKVLGKEKHLDQFVQLCQTYLKNTALKQQIITLINDMHGCADRIVDLFDGKLQTESAVPGEEGLMANPALLCYTLKQALREAAVACVKLLVMCDLFTKRKGELSREERHEIIKYAKSRLPFFMKQLLKFLEVCHKHASTVTPGQRMDIAIYLVPEIELALETIHRIIVETKTALEHVISASNMTEKHHDKDKQDKSTRKTNIGEVLGKTLKSALHVRELMKLKEFHEKTTDTVVKLLVHKHTFSTMTQQEKVLSVSKNFEQLFTEVPAFLSQRVEDLMTALDDRLTWREWKYLFKLGTSKVSWALTKLASNKSSLKSVLTQLNSMVHREQFTSGLVGLGLLEPHASKAAPEGACGGAPSAAAPVDSVSYARVQLNGVESLCRPSCARDSKMALVALELLKSGRGSDMLFEIVQNPGVSLLVGDDSTASAPGAGAAAAAGAGAEAAAAPVAAPSGKAPDQSRFIKAHRVVVAARCDWFRRALLSGMIESIDKKIMVHDTTPELFLSFLQYVYSGSLDTSDLATEQLADLIQLSDRYEMDSLKSQCEVSLKYHLDDDSALFLLSLADQFNAKTLRQSALNYIIEHPGLTDSEIFMDLPEHLQAEAEDAIAWTGLDGSSRMVSGHCHTGTPSSVSSLSEVDDFMANIDLTDRNDASSSSDDLPFMEDSGRLEGCMAALRDIVGDTVPREELVRVCLAADYDVNRALNFFFSS